MKHFLSSLAASVAMLAVLALSVPSAAFAEDASPDTNPPADTTTQTVTDPVPADPVVTETPNTGASSTSTDTSVDTESTTTAATTQNDAPSTKHSFASLFTIVPSCVLVSDTSTMHEGAASVLVSPVTSAWTAMLNGASWIWGENPITDAANQTSETFTKTFFLTSVPASATMTIAADNSYVASVNGTQIASDPGEFNYTASGQDTIAIPGADLHIGLNTLTVTVTNFAQAGGTMATNPAGLLYTLNINGSTCGAAPPPPASATVVATKVVCDDESLLPNWGAGGHIISASTASDYVASHPGCRLQQGWQFEWGNQNAGDTGDSFLGPAAGGYTTFGPTANDGTASATIPLADITEIHLREVQQAGYIGFTHASHPDNSDTVSAEFYCANDALNYDNWDFIRSPQADTKYYCVAFNAPVKPVPPVTSTVKMCKVDDAQKPLSGWTLMLKGAHIGSADVKPDGNDYPVANVPAGKYILTSSGQYTYRADAVASTSDAAYSYRLASDSVYGGPFAPWVRENNFPSPNTGWLGIMLNSAFTDWGSAFHPDHVYVASASLATTTDMHFKILDDQYSDNSGSLHVSVDQGYEGVTGEDGCTTFTNVPLGAYTSAELNQDGWTPISGTGPVTVASSSETLTVVNHHVVAPPTKFKVHIFKYLFNGETSAQIPNDSNAPQFPMIATYSIAGVGANLNPGDSYVLGNGGGVGGSDNGLLFAANTIPLSAGDTYGTHEVTDGSVVVANQDACTVGKYYLKGYRSGTTLADAQNAAMTSTAPNFADVSSDEYVIVTNAACPNDNGNPGGGTATTTTASTVIVHAADLAADFATALSSDAWMFYNDTNDTVDNTIGSFVTGPATAPAGTGSVEFTLGASPMDRKDLATFQFSGTALSKLTSLAFSAYSHSGVAGANESPYLVFNVDFIGSSSAFQGRLVYVPANNETTVPQDTWNTFDTISGGAGKWVYSGAHWPVSGETGDSAKTWSQILAQYPNARILPTGGLLGVRVGEPGPDNYTGDADKLVVGILSGTNVNTTTYDFEPTAKPTDTTTNGGGGRGFSGSGPRLSAFQGQVLGASTTTEPTCGPILSSYLRLGHKNPADQVTILQNFLNQYMSLNLPVSGFFGPLTEKGVEAFQAKYFADVLTPWVPHGLPSDHSVTGYVYKTTLRKVNLVACPTLDISLPKLP